MELDFREFWLKKTAIVAKILFYVLKGTFEENTVLKKFLFCYSDIEQKKFGPRRKFLAAF